MHGNIFLLFCCSTEQNQSDDDNVDYLATRESLVASQIETDEEVAETVQDTAL